MGSLNKSDKITVEALSKSFDSKKVFENLSFGVRDGELLSILGSSGCGKTTLLRILVGLLAPTSGRILKDGVDITAYPPSRRGMGIVFQNYALFENMSVLKNIEYALTLDREKKATARKTALELIELMGLTEHINKRPAKLSGGQQQRVAIARTLAMQPDVILFDEPMSALDVDTRLALRAELKALQERFHTTMIYITHDQEEAFAISDRILVMDRGRISMIDTPKNIIAHPANDYIKSFVIDNLEVKLASLKKHMEPTP